MRSARLEGQGVRPRQSFAARRHHRPLCSVACLADLLVKEIQRRNTFLLYAEAPAAAAAADAGAPAAPTASPRSKKPAQPTTLRGQQQRQQQQEPRVQQQPAVSVAGYIIFTTTGLNAHISKLAVATEWRRRGVARSLVRAAVHAARTERRVASLSLHVDAENLPALGLYRGEGFCEDGFLEVSSCWRRPPAVKWGHCCAAERCWCSSFAPCGATMHCRGVLCCQLPSASRVSLQDYYSPGRHAHKMRLELCSAP